MKPTADMGRRICLNIFSTIFCALFLTLSLTAQEIKFSRAPLPDNFTVVGPGTEDPQGYLWFSSLKGVHRFDGYHFVTWLNDPMDSSSIISNHVESIYAARDSTIWIGTQTSGLDRLDPVSGRFTHYQHDPKNDSSLTSNHITVILQDKKGMIWVGTHKGLNMLDPLTSKVVRFINKPGDSTTLSNNQVRAIYEDRSGRIWIGTGSAFSENQEKEGGLNLFIPETRTFKQFLSDPRNSNSLGDNRVRAIFEDSRGAFWIGTGGDGLHTMDRQKGIFKRHSYDSLHPQKLSRPPLKKVVSWASDHITFIQEDAAGFIWIGTLGNGVNRYDPKSHKVVHIPDVESDNPDVSKRNAWWALSSKDGVIWIGYWGGVFKYDPLRANIPFVETGTSVSCIYKDSSILLYGGINEGLIKHDLVSQTRQKFRHDPKSPNTISNNSVHTIYKDSHGTFWIGTDNGLDKFDPANGKFSRFRFNDQNENRKNAYTIYSILEDREKNIWLSTSGHGIIKINTHSDVLSRYQKKQGDTSSLTSHQIRCMYEDRYGNIWVGFYLGGVNKINAVSGKIEHYLFGTTVSSFMHDTFGVLWVGTESGLYRSNTDLNRFFLYHEKYAEVPRNIEVGAILEDNQKTLWMSSSIGILKLNPSRNRLLVWAKNKEPVVNGFKTNNGQLYFGDRNGYFAFHPDDLKSNPNPPRIVINEFKIGDIPAPINERKGIHLQHDQNTFSFQFSGIHFTNPLQNRHMFMLENFDKTWRKAAEDKTAYYSNVHPGHYIMHIKASSSDGIWSEKIIHVTVNPPWWKTWWAYSVYAVVAASLIWLFIAFRLKNLRSQLARKQKEFEIEELRRQKTEIEMQALRAQMNPHFIFNSLNSINRFILQNNKNDASDYLSKFSRLVRLILNNSQASFIPLQNELEALELYLELESLRFNNHFSYSVNIENDIDTGMLKVPPLMVQPFAENAIWHGLMHKEEKGHLDIEVFIENEMLVCKIRDDGIGRKRAAELKSKSTTNHKSFGMQITASRIQLLQHQQLENSSIVINDLVLSDNSPGGTEVVIKLPVKYD